ncbi:MAG: hypothetical protein LBR52_01955 [Prevotellaceae bacterium]|jgi:hypothetical protein|nr:hypothetical protein [Prevotellaceae bacterium]
MFNKKEKNKYCCLWFSMYHQQPKTSNCIRVFKLASCRSYFPLQISYAPYDSGKERFVENSEIPYRFFLMEPLDPSLMKYDKLFGGYMLLYCPQCGANLFTFYAKERNIEDYVNEIEGETF